MGPAELRIGAATGKTIDSTQYDYNALDHYYDTNMIRTATCKY